MWLEVKATVTIIGCSIIGITLALTGNIIVSILAIMGIGTVIFGDALIGWKIVNTDAINILDPNGPNERTIDLHLIGGGRRILKGKKGKLGLIEFVYRRGEASVIDTGSYPIRFSNGNTGVIAHESYDKNIDMYRIKFLEIASRELKAENVKDMRKKILEGEHNNLPSDTIEDLQELCLKILGIDDVKELVVKK